MGIVRPLMEVFPFAWTFFIPFILVATFTMLNLFIGVIVSAMQSFASSDAEGHAGVANHTSPPAQTDLHAEMHADLRLLRSELAELKDLLRTQERR